MTAAEAEQLKNRIHKLPSSVSGDGTKFVEQLKKTLEVIVKKIEEISNE